MNLFIQVPERFWIDRSIIPSAFEWHSWKASFSAYLDYMCASYPALSNSETHKLKLFRLTLGDECQKIFDLLRLERKSHLTEAFIELERFLGFEGEDGVAHNDFSVPKVDSPDEVDSSTSSLGPSVSYDSHSVPSGKVPDSIDLHHVPPLNEEDSRDGTDCYNMPCEFLCLEDESKGNQSVLPLPAPEGESFLYIPGSHDGAGAEKIPSIPGNDQSKGTCDTLPESTFRRHHGNEVGRLSYLLKGRSCSTEYDSYIVPMVSIHIPDYVYEVKPKCQVNIGPVRDATTRLIGRCTPDPRWYKTWALPYTFDGVPWPHFHIRTPGRAAIQPVELQFLRRKGGGATLIRRMYRCCTVFPLIHSIALRTVLNNLRWRGILRIEFPSAIV